jgi:pyridoxamine 5'-phosphate oxidase
MSFEDEIWDRINQEMKKGADSSKHEFHAFCIANVNGLYPESRIVTLRRFDPEKMQIIFHTDIRSPKYNQLKVNSRTISVFYSKLLKMQLKFKANAILHYFNDFMAQRWNETTLQSRRTYLKKHPPGTIITKDDVILDPKFAFKTPEDHQSEIGFKNFAVVELLFYSLEILLLNPCGNECFKFEWEGDKRNFHHLAP